MKYMAKIQMTHIVYKGVSLAMTAVLGNEIQVTYAHIFVSQPHVRAGRLRVGHHESQALASRARLAHHRRERTTGLRSKHLVWLHGAGQNAEADHRPPASGDHLDHPVARCSSDDHLARRDAVASTPETFDKVVRDDVSRIAGLVKNAGLRAD
jgi:Tripartite tricarboxylate transporter family receptor